MSNPFWFNIIAQWKAMGKGAYGVTFPFLIGAVAMHLAKKPDEKLVEKIFTEMKNKPVNGYYCEVRWCRNINEPVVSISPVENATKVSLKAKSEVKKTISIGFTTDLMNTFHLNCETFDEAFDKLISYTHDITKDNNFSKNGGQFTAFTDGDVDFIQKAQNLTLT